MIKGAIFAIFATMALGWGAPAADSSLAATLARMDEAAAKFKGLQADMQKISHTAVINEDSVDAGTIAVKRPEAARHSRAHRFQAAKPQASRDCRRQGGYLLPWNQYRTGI